MRRSQKKRIMAVVEKKEIYTEKGRADNVWFGKVYFQSSYYLKGPFRYLSQKQEEGKGEGEEERKTELSRKEKLWGKRSIYSQNKVVFEGK